MKDTATNNWLPTTMSGSLRDGTVSRRRENVTKVTPMTHYRSATAKSTSRRMSLIEALSGTNKCLNKFKAIRYIWGTLISYPTECGTMRPSRSTGE